jgi:pimeloyl-ACP methyl ester carboxylesterase
MAKPTVVLVPGAWCPPEIYADVVKHLSSHGYTAKVIALPSVGAEPAKPDATADVEAIRSHLRQLIEVEGQDVVLGLHSYASLPGNNAAEGFSKKEREEKGLKGGIVRFVLLASHPGNEGHSLWASDAVPPEWMKVDVEVSNTS